MTKEELIIEEAIEKAKRYDELCKGVEYETKEN